MDDLEARSTVGRARRPQNSRGLEGGWRREEQIWKLREGVQR